jgi:hypothetical protein
MGLIADLKTSANKFEARHKKISKHKCPEYNGLTNSICKIRYKKYIDEINLLLLD